MKSEKVLVALEADDPVVMDESAGVLLSMLMIVGLLGVSRLCHDHKVALRQLQTWLA